MKSGSPWGPLCSLLQDLQTRPCHHSLPRQMRKWSMKWKQVNRNACCPGSLPAGTGRPSQVQKLSPSTASSVLSLTEHTSCRKLPGRQCGVPLLDARMGEHSSKNLFLQAKIKISVQAQRCRTEAAEADETGTLRCLEKFL